MWSTYETYHWPVTSIGVISRGLPLLTAMPRACIPPSVIHAPFGFKQAFIFWKCFIHIPTVSKDIDIQLCALDAFMEWPSSGKVEVKTKSCDVRHIGFAVCPKNQNCKEPSNDYSGTI